MIICCIDYTLDPHRLDAFEEYARRWPPIIERCGGRLIGYFLPKEGANNKALALIEFDSLAAYEEYRVALTEDPDAKANLDHARSTECILVEDRSFLRRA
ncbi:MAG: NIPSNAP family protein [Pseudonocardiales bacterium]|nr:NIPSNAP family protein [Pseudonocardiales bacterium]MBV9032801.1 NIPSNAP family protein [Pseudonocardiales bacterium]